MKYIVSALLLCFPLLSFPWNMVGHAVVANIAYQNLTPDVRNEIDHLVTFMHAQYPNMESFLNIAYWPDSLHQQKIETYKHWHYIDIAFSQDGTPLKNLINCDNAVWAVEQIEPVVQNAHANPNERVRFLAFLTHIVGDLHQPLHTVSYVSATFPDGDKGGNAYTVKYQNKQTNLHHVWDIGLGNFEGELSSEHINALTKTITSLYPEAYFGNRINNLNPDDWLKEGMNLAQQIIYTTPQNEMLSIEYIQNGKQITEQQAALAGYRLARLLNQLMTTKHVSS